MKLISFLKINAEVDCFTKIHLEKTVLEIIDCGNSNCVIFNCGLIIDVYKHYFK